MINKHIGILDFWCKNELFYKGKIFKMFFEKGGAHAPVAPPLATALALQFRIPLTWA